LKAMILAAGLGTRLRPLTRLRPKVLVPVMGVPVLDFWVRRLHQEGFQGVVVNAFHLARRLRDHVREKSWPLPVEVVEEARLLDTGGGIRNVLDFFRGRPFLVVNGDILCNAPLRSLYEEYLHAGVPAAMLLHHCPRFNNVAVDAEGRVSGFGSAARTLAAGNARIRLRAFTGIQFLRPDLFKDLPKGEPCGILAIHDELIRKKEPVKALTVPDLIWEETGTLSSYLEAHRRMASLSRGVLEPLPTGRSVLVHPAARVAPDALLKDLVVVGENARVGKGAVLQNVVLWDGATVRSGRHLEECVVADGLIVHPHSDRVPTGTSIK